MRLLCSTKFSLNYGIYVISFAGRFSQRRALLVRLRKAGIWSQDHPEEDHGSAAGIFGRVPAGREAPGNLS